jgi:uncharacterized protein (TIRG00374 family)
MARGKKRSVNWGLLLGIVMLIVFISYVVFHLGELQKFVQLARQARPRWLLLGVVFQLLTYWCAGLIWGVAVRSKGSPLPAPRSLARLAIEKLSIDQLFPTTGLSGSLVVARALRKQGLPAAITLEAIVIDTLTYYLSFAFAAISALLILAFYKDTTPLLLHLFMFFTLVVISVPAIVLWVIHHPGWQPPVRLARIKLVEKSLTQLRQISLERIKQPKLLLIGTLLHLAIFLLDGATLWAMLQVTHTPVNIFTAFTALVVGAMAAAVSFMPGGLGGFEFGCTTTLTLLGVSLEAALAATLLLRGLTLWLPLLPGMLLARRDLQNTEQ